jgi:hypothetical protein
MDVIINLASNLHWLLVKLHSQLIQEFGIKIEKLTADTWLRTNPSDDVLLALGAVWTS